MSGSIQKNGLVKPINWNRGVDPIDQQTWDTLTANFWLPEEIALTNDKKSWESLSDKEKRLTAEVFAGLTLLDTVQSVVGASELKKDAESPHEEAIFSNIEFMESVHAKSYSNIFSTFLTTDETDEIIEWAWDNEYLQKKQEIILKHYNGDDPLKKKIASTFLESFLFYSGFFLPFYWSSRQKLTNVADIIALILRDEVIHGYYIGHKYQQTVSNLSQAEQDEYKEFAIDLFKELYHNEILYTESLYDKVSDTRPGLTEEVKKFLRYNGNKALLNLGYDAIFTKDETKVSAAVMSALTPNSNDNHDFFSGKGSSYKQAVSEETTDDDWE